MALCIKKVREADVFVFSDVDGVVGRGVFYEMLEAFSAGRFVYHVFQNEVMRVHDLVSTIIGKENPRVYAKVTVIYKEEKRY